jgi:hypothetical protein
MVASTDWIDILRIVRCNITEIKREAFRISVDGCTALLGSRVTERTKTLMSQEHKVPSRPLPWSAIVLTSTPWTVLVNLENIVSL